MFVADVVRLAQSGGQCAIVLSKFGQHVQRLDVFSVVIKHALNARNVANRFQRRAAEFGTRSAIGSVIAKS